MGEGGLLITATENFWSPLAARFSPKEAAMYLRSIGYSTLSSVCNTQPL